MSEVVTALVPSALLLACIVVIVQGMSGHARQLAALVIAATAGSAVTAAILYRDSPDGQMRTLWLPIVFYGLFALVALRILDKTVRVLDKRIRLRHARRLGA